ncbi:MAG TPA: hypothetical protein VLA93_11295 [Pyrinomonadaceae bacterium]|nr:hypothetical protein [Pyrinomonadaceae bacterium]
MKVRFFVLASVLLSLTVVNVIGQTRPKAAAPQTPPGLLSALPESDGVAQVKLRRLLNEVLPQVLANNPSKLAEINADLDRFKTQTGLDPRSFEQLALGVKYSYPSPGVTKLQTVALANGTFNSGAMVAAGRVASDGKYREEKYQDKTIYIFTIDENVKVLGVFDFTVKELAVVPLDANTLAIADPSSIRNVIDVSSGRQRRNEELIALASRDPNAVVGFGSNLSEQLLKNMDVGNAAIAQDLSAVRQVYGSVGTTPRDVDMFIAARTVDTNSARTLGDTLEGLKLIGSAFVGRLSGARGVLAKSALTNLKISTQANELQIRTAVAQADIAPFVGN